MRFPLGGYANGVDPPNHARTLSTTALTGYDRTRQHYNSPDVASHSAGLRVVTTGLTGLMTFFQ